MAERWSQEHIDLLKANYATKGGQWVADKLGRGLSGVRSAARVYGATGTPHKFTPNDPAAWRPPAKVAHQMVTGRTLHELARDHLAKNTAVYRCTERGGADESGSFWRIGNIVVSDDELLERARAKGLGL